MIASNDKECAKQHGVWKAIERDKGVRPYHVLELHKKAAPSVRNRSAVEELKHFDMKSYGLKSLLDQPRLLKQPLSALAPNHQQT